jgi:hypothetical protein
MCEHCPCPDICLERPSHCRIAAKPDRTVFDVRIICERSKLGELPTVLTMAGNAIAAGGRVVKAVATGNQVQVSPEERDRRWGLCMTCPNLVNDRCKLCGCYFRVKIELATERCPLEPPLWDRVTEGATS